MRIDYPTIIHAGLAYEDLPDVLEPHPLAAIVPEMEPEAFAALRQDIAQHGQLEPITLFEGMILDGRQRYRACRELRIKCEATDFRPRHVPGERSRTIYEHALAFVLSKNFRGRKHLSDIERADMAKRLAARGGAA